MAKRQLNKPMMGGSVAHQRQKLIEVIQKNLAITMQNIIWLICKAVMSPVM
jgi:hypothetical protein